MSGRQIQLIASGCLVVGAALGVAGTFVPSASLRGLAWGVDGVALVVAGALLTIHFVRIGHDLEAAGFLVFVAGETLVVSGSAMDLVASAPSFAAGAGLWAAALALISSRRYTARSSGIFYVASVLLAAVAVQVFLGADNLRHCLRRCRFLPTHFWRRHWSDGLGTTAPRKRGGYEKAELPHPRSDDADVVGSADSHSKNVSISTRSGVAETEQLQAGLGPQAASRIAVTPMPPAVQTDSNARPRPQLLQQLRGRRDYSSAGGGERMADRNAPALHVELGAIDRAERRARYLSACGKTPSDSQAFSVASVCAANASWIS